MFSHHSYRTVSHKEYVRAWLELFPGTWVAAYSDKKDAKAKPQNGFQYDAARFEVQYEKMCCWSENGYGIFFTPNRCEGGRKKADCKGINAWFCDLDAKNGSPAEHIERITGAALKPDIVIESSPQGHHCYWFARDGTIEKFDGIEQGVVHALKADQNCKDLTRVMRLPFFLNQKREQPFMPQIIQGIEYFIGEEGIRPAGCTEAEMSNSFPKPETQTQAPPLEVTSTRRSGSGFWDAAASINNKTALNALSGKPEVRNEVFTFKKNSNGTEQIVVNGKVTSCWLDKDGHIGSHDKGGPTYIQWLKWYGLSNFEIAVAIKKYLRDFLPPYEDKEMARSYSFVDWDVLVDRAYQRKTGLDPDSIPKYHLKVLDDALGGILPTDLVIVGADTGCGKSDLLLHFAIENAIRGKKVLYYQLEMDEEEVADRQMFTGMNMRLTPGWIAPKNYRINDMTPLEREAFQAAYNEVRQVGGGKNIVMYQGGSLNSEEFLESLDITKKIPFDFVVLDHLHYFAMDGAYNNMANNISDLMRKLRSTVKSHRVPVMAASHVRKREKEDIGPSIMDLYGSGDIAKEASVVLLLHRDGDETLLKIAKSRGTGHRDIEFPIHYDKTLHKFVDTQPKNMGGMQQDGLLKFPPFGRA